MELLFLGHLHQEHLLMFPTTLRSISWNYSFLSLHLFHCSLGKFRCLEIIFKEMSVCFTLFNLSVPRPASGPR
uniref:Uncharacterized protein n=1 Tax=Anguilla anguilla TaxID=7936 RepID=A0A0E9V0U3_ANGAN